MGFFNRILPGSGPSSPKDERKIKQDMVEKLCNGLLHASLLEDRRSAAHSLKIFSKQNRLDVGAFGMSSLIESFKRDHEDLEMARDLLEAFITICSGPSTIDESHDESIKDLGKEEHKLYIEFGEILLKDDQIVKSLLNCLGDRNQYIRFDVLQLLTVLEEFHPSKLSHSILEIPSGLSKFLDLLDDDREIIRNENILLLQKLTLFSPEIQRITVFEGIFEKLFDLISAEGGVFGGEVVVEDSLRIIHNLLNYNLTNQNFFKESSCFGRVRSLLTGPQAQNDSRKGSTISTPIPIEWNAQVTKNFVAAVEIISILLNPDNPKLFSTQTLLINSKLFDPLIEHATSRNSANLAKSKSLDALALMVFMNKNIQGYFSKYIISKHLGEGKPIPAVLSIIRMALDGDQLELRISATNMIGHYLSDNMEGQLVIASTFKPPHLEGAMTLNDQSAGSIIIDRLTDLIATRRDPFRVWFATSLLSHVIRGNDQCKLISLNHLVSTDEVETRISLLSKIMFNLIDSVKEPRLAQSSVAYLVLLSTWSFRFPAFVTSFLSEGANIQFLIELINQNSTVDPMVQGCAAFLFGLLVVEHPSGSAPGSAPGSFSRASLQEIIKNRVGVDVFSSRIIRLRNRLLSREATKFHPEKVNYNTFEQHECLFDDDFAEFFLATYEGVLGILSAASPRPNFYKKSPKDNRQVSVETEPHSFISDIADGQVSRFELESLRAQVSELEKLLSSIQSPNTGEGQFTPQTTRERNLESKCTYLANENERLQKLAETYSEQMMDIEKDHEELLVILASYENELKQVRNQLSLVQVRPDMTFVNNNVPSPQPPPSATAIEDKKPNETTTPAPHNEKIMSILAPKVPSSKTEEV